MERCLETSSSVNSCVNSYLICKVSDFIRHLRGLTYFINSGLIYYKVTLCVVHADLTHADLKESPAGSKVDTISKCESDKMSLYFHMNHII